MPVLNLLNQYQKKRFQKALRKNNSADLRERVLILLLIDDGKTYAEIADFIGCSHRTVLYWATHDDPDTLESLLNGRWALRAGNASR